MSEEQQEQMTNGSGRKLVYRVIIDAIEPIDGDFHFKTVSNRYLLSLK